MKWIIAGLLVLAFAGDAVATTPKVAQVVAIPGGQHGLDLDDLGYVPALGRVVVPAGQVGELLLIDPVNLTTSTIAGITGGAAAAKGAATTSVSYGDGYLFASNHAPAQVVVVDAHNHQVVNRTALASAPDYVRYLAARHEVWVTEPHAKQIQVFHLSDKPTPTLTAVATIEVPGGPESLVFDPARHRAYTNLWGSETVAIDTERDVLTGHWKNGCKGSRGLALDAAHAHLFVGCTEGRVVTLDVADHGRQLASAPAGVGIDILSYSPALQRLYVPAAKSASLDVFAVSAAGTLARVASYAAVAHAHCVTADGHGTAFVCDPRGGRILVYRTASPGAR
ncbi:MAG: hypothetical protein EPN74_08345 [Rhodanobacter sp.]|nr:MAG: hypothetical protein EPN74_08345 [Rhodanobacter sp.]